MRLRTATSPCLNPNDVKYLYDLAQNLIKANPEISSQLSEFWRLNNELISTLKATDTEGVGYAPQGIIDENGSRIREADSLAKAVVSDLQCVSNSRFVSPLALLGKRMFQERENRIFNHATNQGRYKPWSSAELRY